MKSASKVGRRRRDHITAWGETVVGLSRITDGRWRVIGTHIRFTEADERKAVERYYLAAIKMGSRAVQIPMAPFDSLTLAHAGIQFADARCASGSV